MFKQYKRKAIAELRVVTENEIRDGISFNISISQEDLTAGSPKMGDMIARNPQNNLDQWLVAAQDFKDNFEEV